jgi:hypothetical protein
VFTTTHWTAVLAALRHILSDHRDRDPDEDVPIKRRQSELCQQHLEVAAATELNCVIHR